MAELRKRLERTEVEAGKLEQQRNQARGEADDLKRELARSLGRPLYDAINRVLGQVLGGGRNDGAGEGLLKDLELVVARMRKAEAEHALLKAALAARQSGYLVNILVGTILLGSEDAIGMIRALVPELVHMEALTVEQADRVHTGLDQQAGGVERVRAELDEGRALLDGGYALRVYGQGAPGLTLTWPACEGSQGWTRAADLPTQWLAEVLWSAHRRAHGYSALHPLAETRPDTQARYRRFAREVAERIDQMRARRAAPLGSLSRSGPAGEPDCDGLGDRRDEAARANTEEAET